jgi:autotransporter-associated beta strand protein
MITKRVLPFMLASVLPVLADKSRTVDGRKSSKRFKRLVFSWIMCSTLSVASMSHAALRTWDGGGTNNFWTTAANWSLDTPPVAGDDLVFPSGAARLINSNNFPAGTSFKSITFSGGNYELKGALIALSVGLTNLTGINSTLLPISLNTNVTFSASDGALLSQNDIDTAGHTLNFSVTGIAEIQVQAPISGTGGITKVGSSLVTISANNSYFGPTDILEGRIALTHSNGLGLATSGTTVSAGAIVSLNGTVRVAEPLVLAGKLLGSSTGTSSSWAGPITVTSNAIVEVPLNVPLIVSGLISGTGSVTKVSPGSLRLTANNTYTGPTTNSNGTLLVDGFQPFSEIIVGSLGTLQGTGTVGVVTCLPTFGNPKIMPGDIGIGRLTTSNLFLSGVTHPTFRLNGTTAGTGYGQIQVHGTANITDATLEPIRDAAFVPPFGTDFLIIDNDGNDPVIGAFRFLPEGTVFNLGGYPFEITYTGGSGNDVVLTRVSSAVRFSSITLQPDHSILLQATGGVESLSYTIQAATNLVPSTQWTNIGNAQADFNGRFSFFDANASQFSTRFYRALSP